MTESKDAFARLPTVAEDDGEWCDVGAPLDSEPADTECRLDQATLWCPVFAGVLLLAVLVAGNSACAGKAVESGTLRLPFELAELRRELAALNATSSPVPMVLQLLQAIVRDPGSPHDRDPYDRFEARMLLVADWLRKVDGSGLALTLSWKPLD